MQTPEDILKNTFLHICVYLTWSKIWRKILEIIACRQALSGFEFLQGSSLMFKFHSRLRLACRKLPAAVGEARKQLWQSLVQLILENWTSEFTWLHICVHLQPWSRMLACRQTLKGWKGIFRCSHCSQGCGGCAESCRQLQGKPANSFGTPRRHLRAVQTSARTANRKQLLSAKNPH